MSSKAEHSIVNCGYVRTMAAYNAEMNERLYMAASRLDDTMRRADRGAFWRSIHGTFNHLLWADQIWMSRFDNWEKPTKPSGSELFAEFPELWKARREADAAISVWAYRIDAAWLDSDLTWFSGAAGREITMAKGLLVAHFFNHQTHHRGQAHALLTAAGEKTGDMDMFLIPEVVAAALAG